MIDELIYTIINGSKSARLQAKADAVTVYGETEGKRRWKTAKKKARRFIGEGGDFDGYYDHLRGEAMTGLRTALLAAIKTVGDAREHADELCAGTATHAAYEDTTYGHDLARYLETVAAALRAARDLHSGILQNDRMNTAAAELAQCPAGEDPCRHGQPWPCQITRASWALHGQDAFERIRAATGGA